MTSGDNQKHERQEEPMTGPGIFLSFRFHGNFYHSYRGDTPDEMGFGKDIRIIRHIIRVLDDCNRRGIAVKGTWDFENYFSLETIMPEHCPDIIAALQRRVREKGDEMQIMSYNNGLVSAHTAREFEASIQRAVSNDAGSGVKDLFGVDPVMVRPQEMMYTPGHLSLYRNCGIRAISLFYSAVPFNSFSNFVPPLTLKEQFNPLTLYYPGNDGTMILMPAYNIGDLFDNLTLRRWVGRLRRLQMKEKDPFDMLLIIDMDADDDFWHGIKVPLLDRLWSSLQGLEGLLENVAGLDYIRFTTPGEYLNTHLPVGEISFGQDTADGSFDGYSSWAEKWSNQRVWTGIERSRILELQARYLLNKGGDRRSAEVEELLSHSFEERLRSLSTTHFGMSAPVMNVTRLKAAERIVMASVDGARDAFRAAADTVPANDGRDGSFVLLDYPRDTVSSSRDTVPARLLVRVPLAPGGSMEPSSLEDAGGARVPCAVLSSGGRRDLLFVDTMPPLGEKRYVPFTGAAPVDGMPVSIEGASMSNGLLSLRFGADNEVLSLEYGDLRYGGDGFMRSAVTYAGKHRPVVRWEETASAIHAGGLLGIRRMRGRTDIGAGREVVFERQLLLAAGLPYLYVEMRILYPQTGHRRFNRGRAARLEQSWDGRWKEIIPCEVIPGIGGTADLPLRVWKPNACGTVTSYDVDYGRFSKNRTLESFNNHTAHGWLAVTDRTKGLLAAETADSCTSPAFCPLRTRTGGEKTFVSLNPFGTYYGKQLRYGTAHTGLGRFLSLLTSDHLDSYAPSFNGREQRFALLLAPYRGDEPPRQLQTDAAAFFYPCIIRSGDPGYDAPPHRGWSGLE